MRRDHGGYDATFATTAEKERLFRLRRRRRHFRDQVGEGATKAKTARLSRPGRRRSDFPDQGGIGANFQTKANAAQFSRPTRSEVFDSFFDRHGRTESIFHRKLRRSNEHYRRTKSNHGSNTVES